MIFKLVKKKTHVNFKIFGSRTRSDAFGEIVPIASDGIEPLPNLRAYLTLSGKQKHIQKYCPIDLEVAIGGAGLLDIHCRLKAPLFGKLERWQLQFSTEITAANQQSEEMVQQKQYPNLTKALDRINYYYCAKGDGVSEAPHSLMKDLTVLLGEAPMDWDFGILRTIWEALAQGVSRRNRSDGHEQYFYQLAGVALRPGFGSGGDEYRVNQLWKAFQIGPHRTKNQKIMSQWWVMLRRIAGGLDSSQQAEIFKKIYPQFIQQEASAEMILLLGALERVAIHKKIQLGNKLVEQLQRTSKLFEAKAWAIARVSSRAPLYAGPEAILHPSHVHRWADVLETASLNNNKIRSLAIFYASSGRRTGLREYDISDKYREKYLSRLQKYQASPGYLAMVSDVQEAPLSSRNQLFGEDLPVGLILSHS